MHSSIRLACDEPSLAEALDSWLERACLEPERSLLLRVRVAEPSPSRDSRPVFEQPTVEIRTGPPRNDVVLDWSIAPARAVLDSGSREASVTLSLKAVARLEECLRTFMMTVLIFLLRRADLHHVHAATAVDPRGRGWLIAGNARAGKSTTAALLASRGWPVGTDDTAFIKEGSSGVEVVSYRAPIALRPGGHALLGQPMGSQRTGRNKIVFWPEELGSSWARSVTPEVLLFTVVGDSVTRAKPISPRQSLTELVRWSAWVVLEPELAQAHLDLLGRLARQCTGYRVTLGRDLFDDESLLPGLIL